MLLAPQSRLRSAGRALLDVVFPRSCVECRGVVEAGPLQHLCQAPASIALNLPKSRIAIPAAGRFPGRWWARAPAPTASTSSRSLTRAAPGCSCAARPRAFVHELKYHRGWHLRGDLRALVQAAQPLKSFVAGAILVPVPLHPRRRRWRGFNQARWVAEALAAGADVAGIDELLNRVRDTPTQTRLSRLRREENMKNAFALRPGAVLGSGRRYVLVDDVFTTGGHAQRMRQSPAPGGCGTG